MASFVQVKVSIIFANISFRRLWSFVLPQLTCLLKSAKFVGTQQAGLIEMLSPCGNWQCWAEIGLVYTLRCSPIHAVGCRDAYLHEVRSGQVHPRKSPMYSVLERGFICAVIIWSRLRSVVKTWEFLAGIRFSGLSGYYLVELLFIINLK